MLLVLQATITQMVVSGLVKSSRQTSQPHVYTSPPLEPPTSPQGANVNTDAEVPVSRFGSGGGFSNIYSIPSYQSKAVSTYLTQHTPPSQAYSGNNNQNICAGGGIYNKAGRGYPDVSAVGDNVVISIWVYPLLLAALLLLP